MADRSDAERPPGSTREPWLPALSTETTLPHPMKKGAVLARFGANPSAPLDESKSVDQRWMPNGCLCIGPAPLACGLGETSRASATTPVPLSMQTGTADLCSRRRSRPTGATRRVSRDECFHASLASRCVIAWATYEHSAAAGASQRNATEPIARRPARKRQVATTQCQGCLAASAPAMEQRHARSTPEGASSRLTDRTPSRAPSLIYSRRRRPRCRSSATRRSTPRPLRGSAPHHRRTAVPRGPATGAIRTTSASGSSRRWCLKRTRFVPRRTSRQFAPALRRTPSGAPTSHT